MLANYSEQQINQSMKFQQCVDFQNSPILTEYLQNIWESHQKHLKPPIEEPAA